MSAQQLEIAAEVLGPILEEVVFLGGATVHLWITEPGAPATRATDDVDVICEVATLAAYYRLGERLRARGLSEAVDEPVICRWKSTDPPLVLDVMPTDPEILGFTNPWYQQAITTAHTVTLASGVQIRAAVPVLLMATKLCAWKGRGNGDLLLSHDIHDVLTLIDGRPNLAEELAVTHTELRNYIHNELSELHTHPYFGDAIDSATAGYGPAATQRAQLLHDRLTQLLLAHS